MPRAERKPSLLLFSFSCSLAVARALIHPSSACDLHHTQVESALKNGHIKTKGTLLVHESRLKESKKQQSNTFSSRALLRRRQCLLIHDAMFYSCQCGVLAAERPPTLLFSVKFLFHFAFSFFHAQRPRTQRSDEHLDTATEPTGWRSSLLTASVDKLMDRLPNSCCGRTLLPAVADPPWPEACDLFSYGSPVSPVGGDTAEALSSSFQSWHHTRDLADR